MRILLADNQAKVRSALRALLAQQPGLAIVGEASEAREAMAQVKVLQPDLVLLDWDLRGLTAAVLLDLRKACPDLIVVALSARPEMRQATLAAGANVFISKTDPPEHLLKSIRDISI